MLSDDDITNNRNAYSGYYTEETEYNRHSLTRKKREKKLRKKRKKIKKIKSFTRFILLICIVVLIYFFLKLPGWYLSSDTFTKPNPEIISIVNNKLVPSRVIYDYLKGTKVSLKYPIFMMPVKPIKKQLYKIPVFKNIYVRRYAFPTRIQIIVRERVPAIVIKTDLKSKPIAFVTTDGQLITNKNYMALAETKTAIKIISNNSKIGEEWTVKRLEYIEKIVKEVEAYSEEKVRYIDMRNSNDVYVSIDSANIRLGMLDSTVFERIKRIYTILPKIDEVEGQVKYIDLSWDKVNYIKIQKTEEKNGF